MQRRCEKRTPRPVWFNPAVEPASHVRDPNGLPLESDFIAVLKQLGLTYEWEPLRFRLLLAKRRVVWFQPDVWLPDYEQYLELTSTKRPRAKQARVEALASTYRVAAKLLVGDQIRAIIRNPELLWEQLAQGLRTKAA